MQPLLPESEQLLKRLESLSGRPVEGARPNKKTLLLDEDAMNAVVDVSQLVYRFNEDEAVWRRFERKRELRRRFRPQSLLLDEMLDAVDWQEAEHEHRNVRCIGFPFPCD